MNIYLILLCYTSVASSSEDDEETFLEVLCNKNPEHILCVENFPSCEGKVIENIEINDEIQFDVLRQFNEFRVEVANDDISMQEGDKKTGGSTLMLEMWWDPLLEKMAKARAKDCNLFLIEDEKYKLYAFTPGQMIFSPNHPDYGSEIGSDVTFETMSDAVEFGWLMGSNHIVFPEDNINGRKSYPDYEKAVGGETTNDELMYSVLQIMKDDHYMVGCAMSHYWQETDEEDKNLLFVCFTGASKATTTDTVILHPGNRVDAECRNSEVYELLCYSTNPDVYHNGYDLVELETPGPTNGTNEELKPETSPGKIIGPDTGNVHITPGQINLLTTTTTQSDDSDDQSSSGTKTRPWIFIFSSLILTLYSGEK